MSSSKVALIHFASLETKSKNQIVLIERENKNSDCFFGGSERHNKAENPICIEHSRPIFNPNSPRINNGWPCVCKAFSVRRIKQDEDWMMRVDIIIYPVPAIRVVVVSKSQSHHHSIYLHQRPHDGPSRQRDGINSFTSLPHNFFGPFSLSNECLAYLHRPRSSS